MKRVMPRIAPLRAVHVPACRAIVSESEPWKRLKEGIDFRPLLRDRSLRALVCLERNEVAGFILFLPGPVFARGGYLRALAVARQFRGRGIGRMLLSRAEEIVAEQAPNFYLCVSSFNRAGQAFYRHCGYRRIGAIPGLIRPGASEYIYWKQLKTVQPRRSKP